MERIFLKWFRDKGNGQLACDVVNAEEWQDGTWPVAVWECKSNAEAWYRWTRLFYSFGVNATTYYYPDGADIRHGMT